MSCKLYGKCYACGTYTEVRFVAVEGQDQMVCVNKCQFPEKVESLTCELCGTTGHPTNFMIVNDPYERCVCVSRDLCEMNDLSSHVVDGRSESEFDEWLNSSDPIKALYGC